MTGFSIAINAWGIHTILHKALSVAETTLWQSALREAVERCGATGRGWGVIADLRGLAGAEGDSFLPSAAPLLLDTIGRPDVERCAVIVADTAQAEAFGRVAGTAGALRKTRILALEGRDRTQIAAAYNWTLNGTQPQDAIRPLSGGAILRFPTLAKAVRAPQAAPAGTPLRRAS